MSTTIQNILETWQDELRRLLDKTSSRITSQRNIRKEFLTPTIVIEMLQIEQQLQQKVVRAA